MAMVDNDQDNMVRRGGEYEVFASEICNNASAGSNLRPGWRWCAYAVFPRAQADICANNQIKTYTALFADEPVFFGFADKSETESSYLGSPVESYWADYTQFDATLPLSKLIKQADFYRHPVMANGKAVCDFTIVLENSQWHPVDVGGNLCCIIQEITQTNGFEEKGCHPLSYADKIFIIAEKDGEKFGCPAYMDIQEVGLKAKIPLSGPVFRNALVKHGGMFDESWKTAQQYIIDYPGEILWGVGSPIEYIPLDQKGVLNRLSDYIE